MYFYIDSALEAVKIVFFFFLEIHKHSLHPCLELQTPNFELFPNSDNRHRHRPHLLPPNPQPGRNPQHQLLHHDLRHPVDCGAHVRRHQLIHPRAADLPTRAPERHVQRLRLLLHQESCRDAPPHPRAPRQRSHHLLASRSQQLANQLHPLVSRPYPQRQRVCCLRSLDLGPVA